MTIEDKAYLQALYDGGKNGPKARCFRKISCLEKRKNELALQETHSWNNTSQVDFLDSNSNSYNEGSLAYLQIHKQAADWLETQL